MQIRQTYILKIPKSSQRSNKRHNTRTNIEQHEKKRFSKHNIIRNDLSPYFAEKTYLLHLARIR